MNHIYKSIWNMALGCWVAAPETARTAGGGAASHSEVASDFSVPGVTNLKLALIGGLGAVLSLCAPASHANTSGPNWELNNFDMVVFGASDVEWRNPQGTPVDSAPALDSSATVVLQTGPVTFAADANASVGAAISGAGGLSKNGTGTLTLTGTNTYTGGTTINAGTLAIGSGGSLSQTGAVILLPGSRLDISGGANQHIGALTGGPVSSVVLGDRSLTFGTADDTAFGGAISGFGGLTKNGTGTLTLTGANTYEGDTIITGGTMALAGAGALSDSTALSLASGTYFYIGSASGNRSVGSLAGDGFVYLGGNSLFVGSNGRDTTFTGNISGEGGLYKVGTGTLTLDGTRSYLGGTTITGGTLVAASAGALGTGAVSVDGGGTRAARLQVNSTLTNAVTVQALGTLAGTGGVGATTLDAGATLAPGQPGALYGALAIGGALAFNAGSVYQVNADLGSQLSSRVNVSGTATLAGAAVEVQAQGSYTAEREYTILSAKQIQGRFGAVSANYAYLDPKLSQTDTEVLLRLTRKQVPGGPHAMAFADLANNQNGGRAAQAVEGLGRGNPLFDHVETLPNGAPASVLAQLSGDSHAAASASLPASAALSPSVSSQHLHGNLTAGMRPGAAVAQSDGALPASAWPSSKALPAWAELVGHWQRYDGDGNAAQLKQRTTGLFLGMDEEVGGSGWRLGGSLGFTHANGKVADRASESDVNSYSAAVYGGKSFGTGTGPRTNVLGGLAYTWHDIETTRHITSLGQTLKADYSGHTAQLFAEVGYAIGQYDKVGFEPFVGVSLGQQRIGSFRERGGFAALNGRSSTDDLASTTLGVRMHSDFQVAGKDARLNATVGWRHAFGDVTAEKTMAFEGSQNFTVAGAPLARNTVLLKLEADVALSRHSALVLGYQGELGSGQRDHAAKVKLRWAF